MLLAAGVPGFGLVLTGKMMSESALKYGVRALTYLAFDYLRRK